MVKGAERLNPRFISAEAVQAVVADISGEPSVALDTLRDKRIKETHFREYIHPEFQAFRIGYFGFDFPVKPEDKAKYNLPVDNISTEGRAEAELPEGGDTIEDSLDGINIMRSFVASAFLEEAERQGLPIPEINDEMIDPPPVKREFIEGAEASAPGLFLYEWEALEERWSTENPPLYNATVQLKDRLAGYYGNRMVAAYGDLPREYLEKVTPEIKAAYAEYLMEYGIRTYAMCTPEPPALIEVTKIRQA